MNNILRTAFVLIFVFGFSSTYVCKVLWACDGDGSHSSHESCIPMVQTKAEGMNEKTGLFQDLICGIEICDIKKEPCCIGQLTLEWTRLWRTSISERRYRKSSKRPLYAFARNSV